MKIFNKPFTREKPDKQRSICFGAFDLETDKLGGGFLFGSAQCEVSANGTRDTVAGFNSIATLFDYFMVNSHVSNWYAHNLEYDVRYLLDYAKDNPGIVSNVTLFERGLNKFFRVDFELTAKNAKGKNIVIKTFDSMAIYPNTLKKFAENFSNIGHKLEIDIANFDVNNPSHIKYALNDTAILLDAMVNFNNGNHPMFNVNIKSTISSTALSAAKTFLPEGCVWYKLSKRNHDLARQAYNGGFTFLTSTEQYSNVSSVDINSSYPSVMREFGVPYGSTYAYQGVYYPDKPGIYKIIAKVPESLPFGNLPFRDANGVCWPRGEFQTIAHTCEIELARSIGCEIEILSGFYFEKVEYIFKDFVDTCEALRSEYKDQPFEQIVKLIQNSVYGKFGTKETGKEIMYKPDLDLSDIAALNEKIPEGENLFEARLDETGEFNGFIARETKRTANYIFPHWAGYITAQARCKLLRPVFEGLKIGIIPLYGDTDSIKYRTIDLQKLVNANLIELHDRNYGCFKNESVGEKEYLTFRAIAPKVYVYSTAEKGFTGRVKGLPNAKLKPEHYQTLFDSKTCESIESDSLPSLHTCVKNNDFRMALRHVERGVTDLNNSVNWFDDGTGKVQAVLIQNGERLKVTHATQPNQTKIIEVEK